MTDPRRSVLDDASDPGRNITVMASAGTGKTWLLITRLVRLLLAGAPPASILAVTFTRKAADEMRTRLESRLYDLAHLDDDALEDALAALGEPVSATRLQRARHLFEQMLRGTAPLQVTTFHAFCQDILRRFPLDADVPPGFEVSEDSGLIAQAAWDALVSEVTRHPDSAPATALDTLLRRCGGIGNTRLVLDEFLQHRADWWAYTQGHTDPAQFAARRLGGALEITPQDDAAAEFFCDATSDELSTYAALLARHATKTNLETAAKVSNILDPERDIDERLATLTQVFFTQKGEARIRKTSKSQQASLGAEGEARLLALHDALTERCVQLRDRLRRRATLQLNCAWYTAGNAFLDRYQHIKSERRVLDFADLEWKTYRLLNQSDHAHWVQYKLDQRIDHILIDEFQDTNPTQWRMVLPLLEELAAGETQRSRSVFLVGDTKQSIYRFRRANPALLGAAHDWLAQHAAAERHTLVASRRSAPAIIDAVNAVFSEEELAPLLGEFAPHTTYQQHLPGAVELIPLVTATDEVAVSAPAGLRNPLTTPRSSNIDQRRHFREGELIARRISDLVHAGVQVEDGAGSRAIRFADVLVLLRSRTHLASYEEAMRRANIPYLSGGGNTLLEALEIRDMVALLETLTSPFNSLALATVLRSPLFACSDEDLVRIARHTTRYRSGSQAWMESLPSAAAELGADHPLARAQRWLARWRQLADQLPVHDLLDQIYRDGNVLERYRKAFPEHLRSRTQANLRRFIGLALEVDSGRYPSLGSFLSRLRQLEQFAPEAIEAPAVAEVDNAVRLMTIHAAKGLEAPVVFLADAARTTRPNMAFRALCEWEADQAQPGNLVVVGRRDEVDSWTQQRLEANARAEQREEANLLYVALTRARQYLFISGCAPGTGNDFAWYGRIAASLPDTGSAPGDPETIPLRETAIPDLQVTSSPDPRLAQPLADPRTEKVIAPSRVAGSSGPERDGFEDAELSRQRGIAIHCILERLTAHPDSDAETLFTDLARQFGRRTDDVELRAWWGEAVAVVQSPELGSFFDPRRYRAAYNEMPISYLHGSRLVQGVIDRLVVTHDQVIVIDYKTQRDTDPNGLAALAAPHIGQMRLYALGVAKLWPGLPVKSLIVFTHLPAFYPID